MNISCTLPMIEAEEAYGNPRSAVIVSFSVPFSGSDEFLTHEIQISAYPAIRIKRETGIGVPIAPTALASDRKILMAPANETLFKRLTRIYFEEGLDEVIEEIETRAADSPRRQFILKCVKFVLEKSKQVNSLMNPRNQDSRLIEQFSQTR